MAKMSKALAEDLREHDTRQRLQSLEAKIEELASTVEKLAFNRAMQQARQGMPNDNGKIPVKIGIPATLKELESHAPYVKSTGEIALMIFMSFDWNDTPEGHDYWRMVMTRLAKLEVDEVPTPAEVNDRLKQYV